MHTVHTMRARHRSRRAARGGADEPPYDAQPCAPAPDRTTEADELLARIETLVQHPR